MATGQSRWMTRRDRPRETWTNVDYGVDFLCVSYGLPREFEYVVGSIGRALMPRQCDSLFRFDSTIQYIALLPLDWSTAEARRAQFTGWWEPVKWCVSRCGGNYKLARDVLRAICFAEEVARYPLNFYELAAAVYWRRDWLLKERKGPVELLL